METINKIIEPIKDTIKNFSITEILEGKEFKSILVTCIIMFVQLSVYAIVNKSWTVVYYCAITMILPAIFGWLRKQYGFEKVQWEYKYKEMVDENSALKLSNELKNSEMELIKRGIDSGKVFEHIEASLKKATTETINLLKDSVVNEIKALVKDAIVIKNPQNYGK